jgi:opacity protein-like surface antigen
MLSAMKKLKLFLLLLLLSTFLFPKNTFKLGAYVGYFRSDDSLFRSIYKGEDVTYGLKLGVRVFNNFSIWLSGMQFKQTGSTSLLEDTTVLTLNPINLSLRYTFRLGVLNPYVEGGYSYVLYKEDSDIGSNSGESKGYSLDAGLEFRLSSHFSIDLGVKYSRCSVESNNETLQLGGTQAGVAFLVVF